MDPMNDHDKQVLQSLLGGSSERDTTEVGGETELEEEQPIVESEEPSPSTVPEPEQTSEEPVEESTSEIEVLRAQLSEMAKQLQEMQSAKPNEQPQEQEQFSDVEFVGEDELDEILSSPNALNGLANKIFRKAVALSREMLIGQIPNIVAPVVNEKVASVTMINDFYREHKELADKKDFVGYVASKLVEQHPDWDFAKTLSELPNEVHKRLGTRSIEPKKVNSNAVQTPRTTRQPAPEALSKMQRDIKAILGR